ncbi:response regulator transcription factor [Halobacteriovorax sp. JY17]|uniref:response regulator transcription factor n=1 Tax=Halobacteriovorax sp. JY17 TaxID=2014617 RepID=UPI000C489C8C|nr:response regulator transcription factor [Halobacteriovorax sp. JY17]PIK16494.1 MAG: hypothetical protein CES88_07075 [Halobacteriovorax sp. JY17]
MQAKIIYFDENIENHLKLKTVLSSNFKTSFFNNREILLDTLVKKNDIDLILLDDCAADGKFFDFLNDLLMIVDRLQVGLVLISSSDIVENRVKAFSYGIDDFVTRPISMNELNARLMNKVQKYSQSTALELKVGNLFLNISDQRAFIQSEDRLLTPIEFKILLTLVRNPERLHTKESLVQSLWVDSRYGKSKSIDTHICNLRRKINGFDYAIKASKGRGISLVKDKSAEASV